MASSETLAWQLLRLCGPIPGSTLSFTGKEIGVELSSAAIEPDGERLWVTFTVSDALLGEQAFSVAKGDALHLGQLFIGETADPNAEFTADHADAFAELFRQFAGTVATQLKSILGRECVVRFKDTQMPEWNSVETASLTVEDGTTGRDCVAYGYRSLELHHQDPLPPASRDKSPAVPCRASQRGTCNSSSGGAQELASVVDGGDRSRTRSMQEPRPAPRR